jgi:predicted RNA methylase
MKVDNDVLTVLARATTEGDALTLVGHLDRKLYERTNKVLEAGGGKWNKKAKAHLFDGGAAEAMEQIIQTGEVTLVRTIQQDYGYFPTPAPVVARLIELAELEPGLAVLEPSAGQGAIANRLWDSKVSVNCWELLPKNAAVLREAGHRVVEGDFLTVPPEPVYDRVVMNPPFAKQADIHHVNHALKFLKPGGRLVSVMSAGVVFRDNKLTTDFRDMVAARGGSIEALEEGAFKASGTMVRTVIVVIPG